MNRRIGLTEADSTQQSNQRMKKRAKSQYSHFFGLPIEPDWPRDGQFGLKVRKLKEDEVEGEYDDHCTYIRLEPSEQYERVKDQLMQAIDAHSLPTILSLRNQFPFHLHVLLSLSILLPLLNHLTDGEKFLFASVFVVERLFSSISMIQQAKGELQINFSESTHHTVFIVLFRFILHLAKTGSNTAAFSAAKFLLSLDRSDPLHVHVLLDSLALKAKDTGFVEPFFDLFRLSAHADDIPDDLRAHPQYFSVSVAKWMEKGDDPSSFEATAQCVLAHPSVCASLVERTLESMHGSDRDLSHQYRQKWTEIKDTRIEGAIMNGKTFSKQHKSKTYNHLTRIYSERMYRIVGREKYLPHLLNVCSSLVGLSPCPPLPSFPPIPTFPPSTTNSLQHLTFSDYADIPSPIFPHFSFFDDPVYEAFILNDETGTQNEQMLLAEQRLWQMQGQQEGRQNENNPNRFGSESSLHKFMNPPTQSKRRPVFQTVPKSTPPRHAQSPAAINKTKSYESPIRTSAKHTSVTTPNNPTQPRKLPETDTIVRRIPPLNQQGTQSAPSMPKGTPKTALRQSRSGELTTEGMGAEKLARFKALLDQQRKTKEEAQSQHSDDPPKKQEWPHPFTPPRSTPDVQESESAQTLDSQGHGGRSRTTPDKKKTATKVEPAIVAPQPRIPHQAHINMTSEDLNPTPHVETKTHTTTFGSAEEEALEREIEELTRSVNNKLSTPKLAKLKQNDVNGETEKAKEEEEKRRDEAKEADLRRKIEDEMGSKLRKEMQDELREELRAELRAEVEEEVRSELQKEIDQKVSQQVRTQLESFENTVRLEVEQEFRQELERKKKKRHPNSTQFNPIESSIFSDSDDSSAENEENERLKEELRVAEEDRARMELSLEDAKYEKEDLERQLRLIEEELNEMKRKEDEYEDEQERQRREFEQTKRELIEAEQGRERAEGEIWGKTAKEAELTTALELEREELQRTQDALDEAEKDFEKAKEEGRQKERMIEELEREMRELEGVVSQLGEVVLKWLDKRSQTEEEWVKSENEFVEAVEEYVEQIVGKGEKTRAAG
ncbi:putative Transcriptional repressor TCF25 [Blattamonas nauphoetae]|uniref:Transcriptional repressor TCF25 n=1 Tax=Blattamonas nauphoetae TaxID=2049346 RepID=A0ABQ9Y223_9EUKA|nr:putative Transcriptional repressor TCF25 [Blattamonas nauphoetae]